MRKRKLIDRQKCAFEGREKAYSAANAIYPMVRKNERNALLNLVHFEKGYSFVDLQSASGYLAEGVLEKWPDCGEIICVEPSENLSRLIPAHFEVINSALEDTQIKSESIDVVVCLAGTHHSHSLKRIIEECRRILKPNGQCIISEVEVSSDMDYWLNQFVNKWTRSGHAGNFVKLGDFSSVFEQAGMTPVYENREWVPWEFQDRDHMMSFIHKIFGLEIPDQKCLEEGIDKYLKYKKNQQGIALDWELVYSKSIKNP